MAMIGGQGSKTPTRKVKVRAHVRTIKVKPFVLPDGHDVGTTAQPKRRGHAPTVFQEPLTRTPTQRMTEAQRRHTARAVLKSVGLAPARPLKHSEVKRVLADKGVQDLLKSTQPFLAKPKKHHSLFSVHTLEHAAGDVADALTARPKRIGSVNIGAQTVFGPDAGSKADKAVQGALGSLTHISDKLAAKGDKYSTAGFTQKATLRPGVAKVLKNAGKDVLELPANVISSTYLTATHPGEVAKGTLEQLKHPLKSLEQHPISTALIFRGGEGALSRGLGDVARLAPKDSPLHEFASTERVPLHLTGNADVQRRYSKGLLENRVQRALDTHAVKKGRGITDEHGNLKGIQATERQMFGGALGGPVSGYLNRRIDQEVGTNASMLRITRQEILHKMKAVQKKLGKHHADAVPLVMEGVLKEGDMHKPNGVFNALKAEAARLIEHGKDLKSPFDRKLNRQNLKIVARLMNDPEFLANPRHVFDAAGDLNKIYREYEAKRAEHGDFAPEAAARRTVLPYAIREHGLQLVNAEDQRDLSHIGQHAQALQDAERSAAQAVRSAQSAVQRTRREEAAVQARTETLATQKRRAIRTGRERAQVTLGRDRATQVRVAAPDLTRAQGERLFKAQTRRGEAESALEQAKLHHDRVSAMAKEAAQAASKLKGAFVDQNGRTIHTDELLQRFEAAGGNREHLGYVHQFKDINQPVNFRGGAGGAFRRPGPSLRFTGASTPAGLYHRNFIGLAEQFAHAAARVERHRNLNEIVNVFTYKQNGQHYFTPDHALQIKRDLETEHPGEEWVAVPVLRKSAPPSAENKLTPAEAQESLGQPIEGAAQHDQGHHVVIMRREVYDRINSHENVRQRGSALGGIQTATQYFRHAVLPTSTKWVVGNTVEAILRTGINDPTLLNAMFTGHYVEKLLKNMGEEGQYRLKRLQAGAAAGHFTSQAAYDFFRPDEGRFMKAVHAVRQTPGAKVVGNAWDLYKQAIFAGNERLESSVYWGALGKEAKREIQSFTGQWHQTLNYGGGAYQDVARGLLDSNNVARYVAAVDKMRGRYSNLSPTGRQFVTLFTPFAPWYVNALHFMAVTLPAHHPIFTGGLAAAYQGTGELRKKTNMPPWFSNALPVANNQKAVDVGYFTPFGAFTGGSAGSENLHSLVLPQVSGALLNLAGKDWTLRDLPKGEHRGLVALNTMLETFVPFLSRARAVMEGGATTKPGSSVFHLKTKTPPRGPLHGLNKAFNPFRPQNANPSGTRASSGPPTEQEILQGLKGAASAPSEKDVLKALGVGG